MRIGTTSLLIAGLVGGPPAAASSAVEAPGSVTVCAKAPAQSAPVVIAVGFQDEGSVGENAYPVANDSCVTVSNAPAPSGAWAQANRQAKRIVVKTPSGKTNIRKSKRVDFSLGSGDNVTLVFYFKN